MFSKKFLHVSDDNLCHNDPLVQERSVNAIPAFLCEYFAADPAKLDSLLKHYMSQLDRSELHRRGFALALGSLPKFAIQGRLDKILAALIQRTVPTSQTEFWAEGRRDAVKAMNNLVKTAGVARGHLGNLLITFCPRPG